MRIFITGIDGFVGRHLAARLAADGHAVEGFALHASEVAGAGWVAACDVRDAGAVSRTLAEARPERIVHLAGQTSNAAGFESPAETFAVNALGTIHVLEAARESAAGRVLLVTTGEVYGPREPSQGPVPETASLAPVTPYAVSKAAQDLIGRQYARGFGLDVVLARSFPHTGPGQDPRFVFPSVAQRIALAEAGQGPADIELGDLAVTRDMSDVRDVVEAYVALLDRGEAGEAYNVCHGEGRTLEEWLAEFADEARCPVRFVSRRERFRPADVAWMVGDPKKIHERTGWRPRYAWRDTVHDMMEYWRTRTRVHANA